MNLTNYLRYFYFVGRNWDFRLAFFTIYHEIKGEKKYRINTIRPDNLHHAGIKSDNLIHSSIYQAVSYYIIEKAFDYLAGEKAIHHIEDFGSGKGRVLAVAASYGFKSITGIDFSPYLCAEAKKNIEKLKPLYPSTKFKIVCDDAVNYSIENDTNVFFFFNPFDETVMLQVVKNILFSLKQKSRKVYIVYANPMHKEIFLSAGFEEEYYLQKLEYLELSILSKEPYED